MFLKNGSELRARIGNNQIIEIKFAGITKSDNEYPLASLRNPRT